MVFFYIIIIEKLIKGVMYVKWFVLNYDFNSKKVVDYNIFNNIKFSKGVNELVEEYDGDFNEFKLNLESLAKYCFWSKREYEISVGDLWEQDMEKYEKIDVYRQLSKNIDVLATYILSEKEQNA